MQSLLDDSGGIARGRRELVEHLFAAHELDEWWSTTVVVEYERAKGALEKDGKPRGYSICSTKTVAAPLERVFAAFGEAKDLDRWLGARTRVSAGAGRSGPRYPFRNLGEERGAELHLPVR